MKKLKPCIVFALLLASRVVMACGPFYYYPSDYSLYRVLPPMWQPPAVVLFKQQNVALWAKQTSCRDTAAIRRAIYEGTLNDWEWLAGKGDKASDDFRKNAFVKWLQQKHDTDAITLLYHSKQYECLRNQMRSPWYYDSHVTNEVEQMRELQDEVMQIVSSRYPERYLFLKLKCAWAAKEDSTVVSLWEINGQQMKGSLLCDEAEDYVARSLERLGWKKEAAAIYNRIGKEEVQLSESSLVSHPNSAKYAPLLQERLSLIDHNRCWAPNDYQDAEYYRAEAEKLLSVCNQAIWTSDVSRKDMWRYAAACCYDALDFPNEALKMLQQIETSDKFLRKSIRALTFHVRGGEEEIDSNFMDYAVGEVKWLVSEMEHEYRALPKEIKQQYDSIRSNADWYATPLLNKCFAFSALQRCLLDNETGCVDRMVYYGYGIRALQMANVADNYIMKFTNNTELKNSRIDRTKKNWHDYSNNLFLLADTMSARTLEQYRQRMLHPQDEVDRWMNARSYTDGDYWQDIIGTHYLRERNYAAAISHLRHVSPSYQRRMNIRFWRDPFSIDGTVSSHDSTHYKLHFAQRMDSLQRAMFNESDADRRALDMLEYAIGLENSFDRCWWLTSYGKAHGASLYKWAEKYGSPECRLSIESSPYKKRADFAVNLLRSKSLQTIRTDDARARYFERLGTLSVVVKRYTKTPTAQHYALVCDTWKDYQL